MNKRLITTALAAFLMLSFTACDIFSSLANKHSEPPTISSSESTTSSTAAAVEESVEAEETTTIEETTVSETTEQTESSASETSAAPTKKPTRKPTKKPTKKPTRKPTKKPTKKPAKKKPTPAPAIPSRSSVPSKYSFEIVWDEDNKIFVFSTENLGLDDGGSALAIGYINGKWVKLTIESDFNQHKYHYTYYLYYFLNGKKVLYCTFDQQDE